MTNSDPPLDEAAEASIEALLADCDEALARGDDPTVLFDRLDGLPAEARRQFNAAYESLRSVKQFLPFRVVDSHFPRPFGKFRLLRLLGQGGFGLVFLAEDRILGRRVALKVPRLHALVAAEAAERFAQEARAAAALEHPHLVPLFETGQAEGLTYLASAYCDGPTLAQWLAAHPGPVPVRGAAELVEVLARAAAYMHARGVVHRDLKPSNVLLFPKPPPAGTAFGPFVPKITDFGLARHEPWVAGTTRTGTMLGTAAYMGPEQAWGSGREVGPATDVYALGVILYELLTGRPPFVGATEIETLRRLKDEEPAPPRRARPDVPRDLETVCLKCLGKRPTDRYPSMAALADDLRRFLDGRPVAAKPVGRLTRAAKWVRRQPTVAALGGLTAVLIAAVAAGGVAVAWREHEHRKDLDEAGKEAQEHKLLADDREWLVRDQRYAAAVRDAAAYRHRNQLPAMRDLLRDHVPADGERDVRGFEWHYLMRFGRQCALPGPVVTRVAYAADGRRVAVAYRDGSVDVFDVETGDRLLALHRHEFHVLSLDFVLGGRHLLSTGYERGPGGTGFVGEYVQWDLTAGGRVVRRKSYAHGGTTGHTIFAPAAAAGRLFVLDRGDPVRVLMRDLDTGAEEVFLTGNDISFVATPPQGDRVAVARERHVELWDVRARERVARWAVRNPHEAVFSPDGKTLAVGFNVKAPSHRYDLLDVPALTRRAALTFDRLPHSPFFDPRGKVLALNAYRQLDLFRFVDATTGQVIHTERQPGTAGHIALSPTRDEIAVGGADGSLRVGRGYHGRTEFDLPAPAEPSEAWCAAFAPDGAALAVGYDDESPGGPRTLKLWNLNTLAGKQLDGHTATVMALAVSPDGTTLATACYDGTVRLWAVATGELHGVIPAHDQPVRAVAFRSDGRTLVTAGDDLTLKAWDAKTTLPVDSWFAHAARVRALTSAGDPPALVSAGNDGTIKVWPAEGHAPTRTMGDGSAVQGLAYSRAAGLLASAHENHTVHLWDVAAGARVRTLLGHTAKVRCVAFSPDGRTLASGGEDNVVRLWHVPTGLELMALPAEHFVNGLAFDPRGRTLAAALHDGRVKVWAAE